MIFLTEIEAEIAQQEPAITMRFATALTRLRKALQASDIELRAETDHLKKVIFASEGNSVSKVNSLWGKDEHESAGG